ncbi:chemotaxis protein CheD [Sulfitobacter marinus]|uniref:Probable chemoreceptor glutamine deamidase CheD n=1 Tax=Sulfitobacter marinus TaxID=394264 RepID=A0A1I6QYK3_9RHOB|nr:chemotaxis protein CheD [Sulfitobacter marinus]SFS57591.1 chemotaxis protein CheD [Sulfitobacter marinus]
MALCLSDSQMWPDQTDDIFVAQGEFQVSDAPDVVLKTLLGSCVATCLFDPVARVGGMNHFLLATGPDGDSHSERYGLFAMEILINGLLKLGARKSRLRAKIFGGATMSGRMGHIGAKNCEFAISFLEIEGMPVVGSSLGGQQARAIRFTPTTGRVSQLLVDDDEADVVMRQAQNQSLDDIQFFGK